jgi:hypothetical protein
VVQFRDLSTQKYAAVAVDGQVKELARWSAAAAF